ncbi:hypothetical protein [Stenotrophomonas sp.]|uniref:hypothetical protein n=1 Tax=Stenotrophomonas sp. TaxID=69392 RepID=UPI0025F8543C|nr:hypothetical protein [Stenotrophomonas sp.]
MSTIAAPRQQDPNDLFFDQAVAKMFEAKARFVHENDISALTDTMESLTFEEQIVLTRRKKEAEQKIGSSVYHGAYGVLSRQHGNVAFTRLLEDLQKIDAHDRNEAEEQIEASLTQLGRHLPLAWTIDRRTTLGALNKLPALNTVGYVLLGGNTFLISDDGSFVLCNTTTHKKAHAFQTNGGTRETMAADARRQRMRREERTYSEQAGLLRISEQEHHVTLPHVTLQRKGGLKHHRHARPSSAPPGERGQGTV